MKVLGEGLVELILVEGYYQLELEEWLVIGKECKV